eukprot:gene21693-28716_t
MARFMSCILCVTLFSVVGADSHSPRFTDSFLDSYPGNSWTRKQDGARNLGRLQYADGKYNAMQYNATRSWTSLSSMSSEQARCWVQKSTQEHPELHDPILVRHMNYAEVQNMHNSCVGPIEGHEVPRRALFFSQHGPCSDDIDDIEVQLVVIARVYRDINAGKGFAEYKDLYMKHTVQMNSVGSGAYGRVYLGHDTQTGERCAIKISEKRSNWRLMRELMIMNDLQGGPNIIKVMDVVQERKLHQPAVILEFVGSTLHDVRMGLKPVEVQLLLYKLISALNFTHSKGYMHRDIKPRNVMADPITKKLRLVDCNEAERYIPGEMYSTRVMTQQYKAPELLVNMQDYDYSLDVWAFGVTLASFIFRKSRFHLGIKLYPLPSCLQSSQLLLMTKTMGTEELYAFTSNYGLVPSDEIKEFLGTHPRKPWATFVNSVNQPWATPEALDLLDKIVRYDPAERLTASEAMQHPYFKSVHARLKSMGSASS